MNLKDFVLKKNWELFQSTLDSLVPNAPNSNLAQINNFFITSISQAVKKSIPKVPKKNSPGRLPSQILNLIKKRHILRKQVYKQNCIDLKPEYNRITKQIKTEISKIKTENWQKFLDKIGKNKTSSKPFWDRIK